MKIRMLKKLCSRSESLSDFETEESASSSNRSKGRTRASRNRSVSNSMRIDVMLKSMNKSKIKSATSDRVNENDEDKNAKEVMGDVLLDTDVEMVSVHSLSTVGNEQMEVAGAEHDVEVSAVVKKEGNTENELVSGHSLSTVDDEQMEVAGIEHDVEVVAAVKQEVSDGCNERPLVQSGEFVRVDKSRISENAEAQNQVEKGGLMIDVENENNGLNDPMEVVQGRSCLIERHDKDGIHIKTEYKNVKS